MKKAYIQWQIAATIFFIVGGAMLSASIINIGEHPMPTVSIIAVVIATLGLIAFGIGSLRISNKKILS